MPPGKSYLLGIREISQRVFSVQPAGTVGRPLRGLAHWPLSRRCGWGLAHPPAQPRLTSRQSASPGVSRGAVGWLLPQVKALALPVEANIYKQGLPLHVADSELSIWIFQMGTLILFGMNLVKAGWGRALAGQACPRLLTLLCATSGPGGTLSEPGFLCPLLWASLD